VKQDSSPKPRAGRRFWLSVLVINLGLLGLGQLLMRRDTLSLLYSLPSPRLVVVILLGIALAGGCLLLIWLYPRVRTVHPHVALLVTLFTSLCLVGSILLVSDGVFFLTAKGPESGPGRLFGEPWRKLRQRTEHLPHLCGGSVKQADYQESETVGLSTYRLSVDAPGGNSAVFTRWMWHCIIVTRWASSAGPSAASAPSPKTPIRAI